MGLPLEGVTVLEFIHTIMGPAYGVVLADLGAFWHTRSPCGCRTGRWPACRRCARRESSGNGQRPSRP